MKKIWIIGIMFILILSNFCYGAEKILILKETNELNSDKSYVSGVFFEEKKQIFLSKALIFLKLVNKDTNESYVINFNFSKNLKIYEIPAGSYMISSFFGTKNETGSINDYEVYSSSLANENYEFNLKTDPALMNEFELHQGEIFYIGDYIAQKIFILSPTAKIIHNNNYENMKEMLEKNYSLDKFKVNHMIFQEVNIESYKYDSELSTSKDKCYLAGRFIFKRKFLSPSSFTILAREIWSKKGYKFGVDKNSDIRYFEVKPGEYYFELSLLYMSTIHDLCKFLPENLKIPFTIKPGEVVYLGDFEFVDDPQFLGSSVIGVKYQFNFDESKSIIEDHFANQNIKITSISN